jgi:septal ring factor EnvC (AmiA/AmiB activator)
MHRSQPVLLALAVALLAVPLSGCRNKQEEARQREELQKALDQFGNQLATLQKQAAELRARFDKLPEDLPDTQTVRDDLHAVEEGLGVEGGRAQWLSGQLDKAFASGKKEEIEAVRNGVPQGDVGIEKLIVKVAHELAPLERVAAQRHFFEKLDAERAQEGAAAKAKAAADPKGAGAKAKKQRPPQAPGARGAATPGSQFGIAAPG